PSRRDRPSAGIDVDASARSYPARMQREMTCARRPWNSICSRPRVVSDRVRSACRAEPRRRNTDDERRTTAEAVARRDNRAAVQVHDVFGDREAEAEPALRTGHLRSCLTKSFEYLWQRLGADAAPGVADLDDH